MPRCILIVLMVTTLAGCGYDHTADWPGVRASGWTWGSTASYKNVTWEADETPGDAPGFSVRLPDGTVLTPDQFTVGMLDARAIPIPVYFTYPSGKLTVHFDEFGEPTSVHPEGDIAVGNRDGTKFVQLPASGEQLVEVFGEPTRVAAGLSNMYWPGVFAMGCCRPDSEPGYSDVGFGKVGLPLDLRSGGPGFSVRLPDGTVLTPDQFTVATLRDLGGTLENPGSRANVRYSKGTLSVRFDEFSQLTRVVVAHGRRGRKGSGDIAIGNRDGTKLVELPATRDEMVELFGEPTSERSYKRPVCLGWC